MSDSIAEQINEVDEYADLKEMILAESEIIATDISYEDFLKTEYGYFHVEWAYGMVIKMPGIQLAHNLLTAFLERFFVIYFELAQTDGLILHDPALMRSLDKLPRRAPDLQVLLPENRDRFQGVETVGPADLVVEIVSKGSQRTDRVTKFREYEKGGVKEYWIIDPLYSETLFYQLNDEGIYERMELDQEGKYHSKVLDLLVLPVALLWQDDLPGIRETLAMVEAMLKAAE